MGWWTSDGQYVPGDYESWVERQIREAQDRGEFDNLPGAGKPLTFLDQPRDPDWWAKGLIERENLDMTAALPPQLALRKEAQTLADRVLREPTEQTARELAEDFNARVRECWRRPVEGPMVPVRTVDVEDLVARWREHRDRRLAAGTPSTQPERPQGSTWARVRRVLGRLTGGS